MEKEIKITIKNGLYEVTLANVNGKEMMLSIGTLLQSVYSHAKQNGKEMMNCFRRQKRQPKLYQAILMKI